MAHYQICTDKLNPKVIMVVINILLLNESQVISYNHAVFAQTILFLQVNHIEQQVSRYSHN